MPGTVCAPGNRRMKKPQSRTWRRQSPQASSFSQQWNVYCNVHSENVLLRHREGGGNVPPRLALVELQKMNRHSRGREVSRDNLWTAWFYGGSWVMEECGTKRSFVLTEQSLFVLTEGYVVKKGCVCMCAQKETLRTTVVDNSGLLAPWPTG